MANKLTHLDEFKKILSSYNVSEESKKILNQTKLAVFVAPTSVGRNTIIRELLKTGDYNFIVSDTTRQPRINDGLLEKNGVEYWFRDEEDVLKDLREGRFIEAAVIHNQQVSGISIRELEKASLKGKIAVADIEIAGANKIMPSKPDTIAFYVLPPSFEEWQRRIKHRGPMTNEEFRRRMESARQEFAHALEENYYYFIINDSIKHVLEEVHTRAVEGIIDDRLESEARALAKDLLEQTNRLLDS